MASAIFVLRMLCAALLFAISDSLQKTVFTKFTQGLKWNEARQVCLSLGSDLAVIDRYATEYLLQAFAVSPAYNTDNVWIGLHDVGLQPNNPGIQGYQWSSCDALDPGGWSNWQTGEPLNRWNNWCIRLQFQHQLTWYAEQCASMAHFLCQRTDGPCTDFKSTQTGGCDVSSEWLTKTTKNTTSATSDSECRGDCQSYGQEDGSPLCWAYQFDGTRCGLYVTSSPVMCQPSGGATTASNLMVRDCYSISYETVLQSTPKNSNTEPQVDCSAVTTTSVQAPTATATTTTENTTPAQPTSALSSMTSSSTVTSPEIQTTAQMTEKITSSAPALEITSVATTATTPTTQPTSTPATENTTPEQPTTTSSSVTSSSSVTASPGLHDTTSTTTEEVTSASQSLARTTSPNQYPNSTTTTNYCACSCRQPIAINISATMATELANRLQEELRVNISTLSSTRRRKESAADDRPTAQATGGIGIAVLVFVACLIMLPDLRKLAHTLCVSGSVCSRDQRQQFEENTAQEMEHLDSKA